MLKTVKGKVIAGVVSVGLLVGGGAALASTDAGGLLKDWYDTKFGAASSQVISDSHDYANGLVGGLANEYNGLKNNTSTKLKTKGEDQTGVTNGLIDKKSQRYIDQIEAEKANIDSYLSLRFDDIKSYANGLINETGKDALDYANKDLAVHAAGEGAAAIAAMNLEVKGATEEAAKRLQDAINNAKSDLQKQLDENQEATTAEIKKAIDAKVINLRTIITSTNNQLILKQEKSITFTAKSLLLAGQDELDAIVGNINK